MQFAKQAGDRLLEYELKNRDSNESNNDKYLNDSVKSLPKVNDKVPQENCDKNVVNCDECLVNSKDPAQ